jgi:EpsI family protein
MTTVRAAEPAASIVHTALPASVGNWLGPSSAERAPWWKTPPEAPLALSSGAYSGDSGAVQVEVFAGGQQAADEIVGSLMARIDTRRWQILRAGTATVDVGDTRFVVQETEVRSRASYAVLWHWYQVGDVRTGRDWYAKLHEAWNRLSDRGTESVVVVISAQAPELLTARDSLRVFVQTAAADIERCLEGERERCAEASL